MAQRRKDEVKDAIVAAALRLFARDGFEATSIGRIAREAGVSTGNVYRYFTSKDELFAAVLPAEFVRDLEDRLRRRVAALAGVDDVRSLAQDAPFHTLGAALVEDCLANRERVVLLLGRAEGTPYEGFEGRLRAMLAELAEAHFRALDPERVVSTTMRFALDRIYRGFLATMVATLVELERPEDVRQAVADFSRYHLAGLARFFAGREEE